MWSFQGVKRLTIGSRGASKGSRVSNKEQQELSKYRQTDDNFGSNSTSQVSKSLTKGLAEAINELRSSSKRGSQGIERLNQGAKEPFKTDQVSKLLASQ